MKSASAIVELLGNSAVSCSAATNEQQFIFLASRFSLSLRQKQHMQSLAQSALDWDDVRRQAEYHSVVPIVMRNVKAICYDCVPAKILEELNKVVRLQGLKSVFLSSELLRLQSAFNEHGIEFIPFKGPVLSKQAFGDACLRSFTDLDVIVRTQNVSKVFRLLVSLGFSPSPHRTAEDIEALLSAGTLDKLTHEHTFIRPPSMIRNFPLQIDVHWNIAPSSMQTIAFDDIHRGYERIELCGQQVETMSAERCLVALAVHAAKHQFSELKWLVDIAELATRANVDWVLVYDVAQQWRVERMIDLALMLAATIGYELDLPEFAVARLSRAHSLVPLCRTTHQLWLAADPTHQANLREYYMYICRALGRPAQIMKFLMAELTAPNMVSWQRIRLPSSLFFLYRLITPAILINDFWRQRLEQQQHHHNHQHHSSRGEPHSKMRAVRAQIANGGNHDG
jgi:hypothetical protein